MSSKIEPLDHHTLHWHIDTNQLHLSLGQGLISRLNKRDASTQVGLSLSLSFHHVSALKTFVPFTSTAYQSFSVTNHDQPIIPHYFQESLRQQLGYGNSMELPKVQTCLRLANGNESEYSQQRRLESCGCHQVPNLYCLRFLSTVADFSEPKGRILKWNSTTAPASSCLHICLKPNKTNEMDAN